MELKYIRRRLLQEAYGGFNRTFMELKYSYLEDIVKYAKF